MKTYELKNEKLSIEVESLGAQLCSVKSKTRDYLWNGDPTYWSFHSPILFPFVGRLRNSEYLHRGKKYSMMQHGFARDMEFELELQTEDEIWFCLRWNEETLTMYPFEFVLHVGYRLEDNKVTVLWKVENRGDQTMYFAIGGHPGFNCPIEPQDSQFDYLIEFDRSQIEYCNIDQNGLFLKQRYQLPLINHQYRITEETFSKDALIIETHQTKKISLCTPDHRPYVTVLFDSPTVGIFSQKKMTPYVCIEPWYGRCDNSDFEGELSEREQEQKIETGCDFQASYRMEFN